jgi:hypothetical protein
MRDEQLDRLGQQIIDAMQGHLLGGGLTHGG